MAAEMVPIKGPVFEQATGGRFRVPAIEDSPTGSGPGLTANSVQ